LAAEYLHKRHQITVSKETLRPLYPVAIREFLSASNSP